MSLNNLGMGIVFTASDLASNVIQGLSRNFLGLGDTASQVSQVMANRLGIDTKVMNASLKSLTVGVGIASAGVAGLVAAVSTIGPAAELQDVMLSIQQKTRMADGEIENLRNDFLKLSSDLPLSATELAKVGVIAGQLGISTTEGIKALAFEASQFARTTDFTEETGAAALARLSKIFDLPIEKANQLGSSMVFLANTTTATASGIFEITKRFGGEAKLLGITAAEANAFSATMIDAGVNTEVAGSSLAKLIGLMLQPQRIGKFAAQLGISTEALKDMINNDASGTIVKLLESFKDVDKFGVQEVLQDLGIRSTRLAGSFIKLSQQTEALKKNLRAANTEFMRGTAMQDAFDKLTKSLNAKIDTLTGSFMNIAIEMGTMLLPVATAVVEAFIQVASVFLNLPVAAKKFLILGSIFLSLTLAVGGFVVAFTAALPIILPALAAIKGAVLLAALPFIKIIAVVGLVIGALLLLKSAWDANVGGIRDALLPVLEKVGLAFRGLFALVTGGEITGDLAAKLGDPKNSGVLAFIEGFSRAFAIVKGIFGGIFDAFRSAFDRVVAKASPIFFQLKRSFMLIGGIVVDLGKTFGELFGLKTTENGIDSIERFASVITTVLINPLVFGLGLIADTFSVLVAVINAVLTAVKAIAGPFVDVARVIGGAFQVVFGAITGNSKLVFEGIAKMINGVFGLINKSIRFARDAVLKVTPKGQEKIVADRFNAAIIPEIDPSKVAFALGADMKTVQDLDREARREVGLATSGTAKSETFTGTTSVGGSSVGNIPASTPGSARAQGGLTATDIQGIIEASIGAGIASERGRPIVVQGTVALDGQRMGVMRAQQDRDARARAGAFTPSLRDE